MKRFLAAAVGAVLMTMATAHGAWAFGIKDVLAMHESGLADSLIIKKIAYSGTSFDLDAKEISVLKTAGVSDAVISEMLETEARAGEGPYVAPYYPYYGPYPVPYYEYYGPYYPRVSVGLRFGYLGGYRGEYRHWHRI